MRASVSLEQLTSSSTCARTAMVLPMEHPDVLRKKGSLMVIPKGATPVRLDAMVPFLNRFPDMERAELLRAGFSIGFCIPTPAFDVPQSLKNLRLAELHTSVVSEKLSKEVALGRMSRPFHIPPFDDLVVSPLGVVPKKDPNKFRLIQHLSYPKGRSVNDGIDPELCSVVYTSFDEAAKWVRSCVKGALLAKTDIESAFRLLPVHPASVRLLGCYCYGGFYVDRCLPMGCLLLCTYFEAFSSFLEWAVRDVSGLDSVIHYLDDFLCIGPDRSPCCEVLLRTVVWIAELFGVPFAPEKTEGPCTSLSFLGIVIDSVKWEFRLPVDKELGLRNEVARARCLKKLPLREVQSLLRKLNFACRIIPMGRVFFPQAG
ncbi:uncharacterized protein LOC143768954 [Ranitomeya variabilis]|uniref:uncharacterized protein LOC143768954 n=1 Tax=Ranitomeya variabilis TaxID=490064 RepID=UPI0040559C80